MSNVTQVSWDSIHERMLMNSDPPGWFSVFKATQPLLIDLKRAGLNVGAQTVPDISIGQRFSAWWTKNELARKYGERTSWQHRYPADHPQARAHIEPWIYPLEALGEFMVWLQNAYLPVHLPAYLDGQVAKRVISVDDAPAILAALVPKRIKPISPSDSVPILKRAIRSRPKKK